ncbi:hypothetical protein OsI_05827 [Oryza sativa Indica Group]|uniref:Uncharacterized protein n=1 Tax=Oryza sativa subsp. indica TaxID=39946 RepID=B8AHH0_ORYSI|nr:hypothetical protein OsI_05827 [Oryza sativa Indica Group]
MGCDRRGRGCSGGEIAMEQRMGGEIAVECTAAAADGEYLGSVGRWIAAAAAADGDDVGSCCGQSRQMGKTTAPAVVGEDLASVQCAAEAVECTAAAAAAAATEWDDDARRSEEKERVAC